MTMQVIYQKYLNKAAEVSKQLNLNNPRNRQYITYNSSCKISITINPDK